MIALLENGCYLSTDRLVDASRCEITRNDIPKEPEIVRELARIGLNTDFTTIEATLMQASCIAQEEKIYGQPGFTKLHGILDLMALKEAMILQNFNAQGDIIADPWQLQGSGFTFHHELFRHAVDTVAVTPVDWERIDTSKERFYLYTENFTSTLAFSRMIDAEYDYKFGSEGYQISTLVDCGSVMLPPAPIDIHGSWF